MKWIFASGLAFIILGLTFMVVGAYIESLFVKRCMFEEDDSHKDVSG